MIDDGRLSEDEAEHMLVQSLKHPGTDGHDEFKAKTEKKMKLETKELVGALNEHIELRVAGNRLYGEFVQTTSNWYTRNPTP